MVKQALNRLSLLQITATNSEKKNIKKYLKALESEQNQANPREELKLGRRKHKEDKV